MSFHFSGVNFTVSVCFPRANACPFCAPFDHAKSAPINNRISGESGGFPDANTGLFPVIVYVIESCPPTFNGSTVL